MHPAVHTLVPEGVVVAIARVEKEREEEVLIMEVLEHHDVDTDKKEVE